VLREKVQFEVALTPASATSSFLRPILTR